MPRPVLCGDPATQPLRPCLGPGSIQGPDRYRANLEEPPLLTHVFLCGGKCTNSSYISFPTDLGTGEGVQKNQH